MNITGKTTLTKFIVEFIKLCHYTKVTLACAPNHSARKILSNYSGLPTSTIHSLLKIRPDNYETEIIFSRSHDDGDDPLATCRILIVDEISFIDRDLFDILLDSIPNNCLIIGLGNKDQLKPIPKKKNGEAVVGEISPFFTDDRFWKFGLTEIKRSDNPVTLVGEAIRLNKIEIPNKDYLDDSGEGVHVMRSMKEFMNEYFERVKTPEDFKNNRIVAFSNDSVDQLNRRIRERLYNTKKTFLVDEILVTQAPCFKIDPEGNERILFDNGSYLKITDIREYTEYIRVPEVPDEIEITSYKLGVVELDVFFEEVNGRRSEVTVMHPDEKEKYSVFLDRFVERLKAIKKMGKRPNWKSYFDYRDKTFVDVKYLPACTIHKSQGITVDNVFYFVDFVANLNDRDFVRRLTYVAVTRSRFNSFLLL